MKKLRRWLLRTTILLVIGAALGAYLSSGPDIEPGTYLVASVAGKLDDERPNGQFGRLLKNSRSLLDLTDNLRKARSDGRVEGVIVRLGTLGGGWGHAMELRDSLAAVKAEGKTVHVVLEGELGPANKEFYLASVADKIWVPAANAPLLNGLSAEFTFLGGLWDHVDIDVHVEQLREYKTAGDSIARKEMSAAHREMAESLLDSLDEHFRATLAAARNLTVEEVGELIDACPNSAEAIVEAGLADGVKTYDALLLELGDDDKPVATVSGTSYAGVSESSLGLGGGPKIAVVHLAGTIVSGGTPRRGNSVGASSIGRAIAAAADDEEIQAIVIRVNSPGGSPAASDQIWQQIRLAADKKPVVASMGNVAASGGYYVASAADRILADAGTITGSIGVVFIKPDISGLLGRYGVNTEGLGRGRYSRLLSLTKGFDDAELDLVRTRMNDIYALFVERVDTGRTLDFEQIDELGGGRVWTGLQAEQNGLIDDLGGLEDAIALAAKAAGIHEADRAEIVYYPRFGGLLDSLMHIRASAVRAIAEQVRPAIPGVVADRLSSVAAVADLEPGAYTLLPVVPRID